MSILDVCEPYTPMINRNMRCIEIFIAHGLPSLTAKINRNMRCIEILLLLRSPREQ